MPDLSITLKALRELGPRSLTLYAIYRLGLITGHYRRLTQKPSQTGNWPLKTVLPLPPREEILKVIGEEGKARVLTEAEEIIGGKVRLFGGEPVPLQLAGDGKLAHWTYYETGKASLPLTESNDIKFIWEPARFGWAFTLGRAYHITADDRYARAFWEQAEKFIELNSSIPWSAVDLWTGGGDPAHGIRLGGTGVRLLGRVFLLEDGKTFSGDYSPRGKDSIARWFMHAPRTTTI